MRTLFAILTASLLAITPVLAEAQPAQTSDQSCDGRDQNGQRSDDLCSPFLWIVGGVILVGATVGIVAATTGGHHHHAVSP